MLALIKKSQKIVLLYWSRKPGSLAKLIDKADQMSADEIAEMGLESKEACGGRVHVG